MADCTGCPIVSDCNTDCGSDVHIPQFVKMAKGSKALTTIAVGSGKGGVGKSTVTAILAVMLSQAGFKVGIFDADVTGPSMAHAFGINGGVMEGEYLVPPTTLLGMPLMSINLLLENKDEPVVWRGPLIAGVIQQFWSEVEWGVLDVMLIDMPPGTGDVPITVFQSIPVDRFLVVTTPSDMVQMIVNKAAKMAVGLDVPILGLVENMAYVSCDDCDKKIYPFGQGKTIKATQDLNISFLDELGINPEINKLIDKGRIELLDGAYLTTTVKTITQIIERKRSIIAQNS